jgi:hypothetical protein
MALFTIVLTVISLPMTIIVNRCVATKTPRDSLVLCLFLLR